MKKILFCIGGYNETPYSEHIPLANYLKNFGFESFFLLNENYKPSILEKILKNNHRAFINENEIKEYLPHSIQTKTIKENKQFPQKKFLQVLKEIFKVFKPIIQINRNFWVFKKSKKIVKIVGDYIHPNLVILYGDRVLGDTPAIIQYCKKNQIPIFDIEIAVSNLKFLSQNIPKSSFIGNLLNRLCSKLFKVEPIVIDNRTLFFYNWTQMFPMGFLGITLKKPWYIGSNGADYFLRKFKVGQPHTDVDYNRTIKTVGQFSLDKLFETYKDKEARKLSLISKYFPNIQSYKNIIIMALPQMFEHNLMSKDDAIENINYMTKEISDSESNLILISLHPKMAFENYNYLNTSKMQVMKEERLFDILPTGDLFISCFESTIQWAILCDVVPIFLDYFDFGFDLSGISSCHIFKDKSKLKIDFEETVKNISKSKKRMHLDRCQYLPFDGKVGERILHQFNNL